MKNYFKYRQYLIIIVKKVMSKYENYLNYLQTFTSPLNHNIPS